MNSFNRAGPYRIPAFILLAVFTVLPASAQVRAYPPVPDKWDILRGPFAEVPQERYELGLVAEKLEDTFQELEPIALQEGCSMKYMGTGLEDDGRHRNYRTLYTCEIGTRAAQRIVDLIQDSGIGSRKYFVVTPRSFGKAIERGEKRLKPLKDEYENNLSSFKHLPIAASLMEGKLDQLRILRLKGEDQLLWSKATLGITVYTEERPSTMKAEKPPGSRP